MQEDEANLSTSQMLEAYKVTKAELRYNQGVDPLLKDFEIAEKGDYHFACCLRFAVIVSVFLFLQ